MRNCVLLFSFLIFLTNTFAQSATDIFVFDINLSNDTLIYSNVKNITKANLGYDNQPNFSADGKSILYTAIQENGKQADIYEYNIAKETINQITDTETSEYSPTQLKKSTRFSTVKVEEDGTQRLWVIDKVSKMQNVLLSEVKGIGYHTWLTNRRLALFVVGKPHELHIANAMLNTSEKIKTNIGSAIHKKEKFVVGYMDFTDSTNCRIMEYNIKTMNSLLYPNGDIEVCDCIKDSEYFIYLQNGNILSGLGTSLYLFNRLEKKWKLIADFSEIENFNFYRLAINKTETKLALVTRNN